MQRPQRQRLIDQHRTVTRPQRQRPLERRQRLIAPTQAQQRRAARRMRHRLLFIQRQGRIGDCQRVGKPLQPQQRAGLIHQRGQTVAAFERAGLFGQLRGLGILADIERRRRSQQQHRRVMRLQPQRALHRPQAIVDLLQFVAQFGQPRPITGAMGRKLANPRV